MSFPNSMSPKMAGMLFTHFFRVLFLMVNDEIFDPSNEG